MILDVLVFLLGFCAAGLLALACLPAVWARALRLTEERLSRLVPLSPDEIAAERDHLRAAHAVELRRVEQKLEGAEKRQAALRVEAAGREAHIAAQDEAAIRAEVRIAEFETEAAQLRRECDGLWAEHGAETVALDGLARSVERRLEEVALLQAERAALAEERDGLREALDASRSRAAGLETRLIGAETRGGDLERDLVQSRQAVTAAAERLAAAAAERLDEVAALQAERAALAGERDGLREALDRSRDSEAGLETRGGDLERDLAHSRQAVTAAAERLAAAAAEREAAAPGRTAAEERGREVEALKAELAFMVEQAHSAERRAADSLRAYEALRDERAEAPPAAPRDDAGLRAAVAALADEVLRATRPSPAEP